MLEFGELRALLHSSPSPHVWTQLCALLSSAPHHDIERHLPYIHSHLQSWPDELRQADASWFTSSLQLWFCLSTRLNLHLLYTGPGLAGKRTNLRQLHDHCFPSSTKVIHTTPSPCDGLTCIQLQIHTPWTMPDSSCFIHLFLHSHTGHRFLTESMWQQNLPPLMDAIVFVADSQPERASANLHMLEFVERQCETSRQHRQPVPLLIQLNKYDLHSEVATPTTQKFNNKIKHLKTVTAQANQRPHDVFCTLQTCVQRLTQQRFSQGCPFEPHQ